jgi:ATP-binding cassette subfamily F protein uup
MANGSKITASQFLNQFHFPPPAQQQKIENLSGGEKRRVQLMMTLLKNPNFLILDEPSNDFDINTLHVLEEFLQDYPGTILIVSHDRFLLDKLSDHLLVFEGDGIVSDFPGNYTQWKWSQEDKAAKLQEEKQAAAKRDAAKPVVVADEKPKAGAKLSFKERQELENLEFQLESLETKKKELESLLSSGAITDHQKLHAHGQELVQINSDLDEKTMRWLELSERAEVG